jgi:NADH dehydrogenase [ubiquinone] 1 alpha subcomplex assembly factor 7
MYSVCDSGFNLKGMEVCPEGIHLAGELAKRVVRDNGAALIIDYGQDGPYSDSLVGIRNHKSVDIFEQPGMADLSSRVDFDALR